MNDTEKKTQLENCRRAYAEKGVKRITITHESGTRSEIENPDAIRRAMAALGDELAKQLAECGAPAKRYVILDPNGRFFRDFTDAIPLMLNGFTDMETWAWKMDTLDEAKRIKSRLLDRLYTFDGQNKVPADYLRIAEIRYEPVG